MTQLNHILSGLPEGLKKPLIAEYNDILQRFFERRWAASELSGGRFCEIVFTILDGHAKNSYANKPAKPKRFVDACRALESNVGVPRSFQILIPRMLPALYEIRNNRNVGHVGGDVDPNFMDAQAVVSMTSWIMGELIRVFHNISPAAAQKFVDGITQRKIPLIWETQQIKRVLNPRLSLKDQILLLISSSSQPTKVDDLLSWTECKDKKYFLKTLRALHRSRLIELAGDETQTEILPGGLEIVEKIIAKLI